MSEAVPPVRSVASFVPRRRRTNTVDIAAATALALGLHAQAQAQTPAPITETHRQANGDTCRVNQVYTPEFFQNEQPQTALDMVGRVPGFQLVLETSERGLGGRPGNVLINGEPIARKSQSAREALSQIRAPTVARIEVIEAGQCDIAMNGHTKLVNVVLAEAPHTVSLGAHNRIDGDNGHIDIYDATLNYQRVSTTGRLSAQTTTIETVSPASYVVSAEGSQPIARTRIGTGADLYSARGAMAAAGGRVELDGRHTTTTSAARPAAAPVPGEALSQTSLATFNDSYGAQWRREIADGIELTVQGRLTRIENETDLSLTSASGASASHSERQSGERAGRADVSWRLSPTLSAAASADVARNTVDGALRYTVNGTLVPIGDPETHVKEIRTAASLGFRWQALPSFIADVNLRAVRAVLEANSASGAQTNKALAPRLVLTYAPNSAFTFRFRAEREIAQLDFSQFLDVASLEDDVLTAGAGALAPETSWIGEVRVEHRFGERAFFNVSFARTRYENPIEMVALTPLVETPANVSAAIKKELAVELSLPLDQLHLPGAVLTASGNLVRSETTDPVTGETRSISDLQERLASFGMRQDLFDGAFIWEVNWTERSPSTSYGVSRVSRNTIDPIWEAWAEWRPRPDLTLRLDLSNGRNSSSETAYFAAPRTLDAVPEFVASSSTEVSDVLGVRMEWRPTESATFALRVLGAGTTHIENRQSNLESANFTLSYETPWSAAATLRLEM